MSDTNFTGAIFPTWAWCGECHQVISGGLLHVCPKKNFDPFSGSTAVPVEVKNFDAFFVPDPRTLLWVADWIESDKTITNRRNFRAHVISKLLREMVTK